jgi:hypothetical protein
MLSVGFNNSFIHTILSEEDNNNLGVLVHNVGDLEIVISSNEFYKKKGKGLGEKSAQYPIFTPKNNTSRRNDPTTYPTRKFTNNSSSDRGEKNPPSGKTESSQKIPLRKKRKNVVHRLTCWS